MKRVIRFLVLDVDGTLTDGRVYMGNDGELFKAFNIKDGCGIALLLPQAGITPVIITSRRSSALERRCAEIGVTYCFQGVKDKVSALLDFAGEQGADLSSFAYMGDDINDIPCMKAIKDAGGWVACPSDSAEAVITLSDFVSSRKGGDGAVREFIDNLVR